MGGWLGLRPEVALLKSALPEQTISEMDELFGKGVGSRRNIDCMYLFGERVKRGNKIDFELTTEEFDEHFVRRVPEIARAVDVIAGSREGLRACALDAGLSPHPPGRIQLFQFRAAALLMAAWYGRDVFNELVSEYRAAKDAGQWMKRAESDDFVDRFVEIVYSVPEESWAAMRVGGL
ncbi:Hypothetical protein BJL86_0941 [Dietzia timorensis]|uniref:Uncharacterized protein n=2 Tax=Dietzia timorensis TaxID=499555 RepID=A0A173LJC6_9ACTN|nr:Hypothetical protein BJL86_0941 [Dietzia timorensis]